MMRNIICIITLSVLGSICSAQPAQQGHNEAINKKIQNEKIAYFTSELDLTSEEAQAFWPIYFEYQKESEQAHKTTMQALWEASRLNGKKDASESEIDKVLTAYNKALKNEASLAEKYYVKYKRILPASKIAKLYFAEESFKMVILNKFRKPVGAGAPAQKGPGHQNFGYKSPVK